MAGDGSAAELHSLLWCGHPWDLLMYISALIRQVAALQRCCAVAQCDTNWYRGFSQSELPVAFCSIQCYTDVQYTVDRFHYDSTIQAHTQHYNYTYKSVRTEWHCSG